MADVTFFANSTGGPPRIWATKGVTGSYMSGYNYATKSVPLAGNGLTAQFNVKTWDTANGKWLSTVSGSGPSGNSAMANGASINFRGAAAGTINTTAGTFSGTAAGTAK